MSERRMMASRFKAKCLALLDEVARTKVPIVVTKRGEPVARLVPLEPDEGKSLMGSVTLLARDDEEYFSTGERWEAAEG